MGWEDQYADEPWRRQNRRDCQFTVFDGDYPESRGRHPGEDVDADRWNQLRDNIHFWKGDKSITSFWVGSLKYIRRNW